MPLPDESKIIITCSNRLSPYLKQEVESLGLEPVKVFKTGIELWGTIDDCIKLNLHLRCASQIHYLLKDFTAFNATELYDNLVELPWEEIIPAEGYFSITSNVTNDSIDNNLFANVKVKDAIVDRFRNETGSRPDSGSELNKLVLHLYWKDNEAEIFLDTSGETLSKHGYRKIPGKAPMLESLAAATLYASGWDTKTKFINPMCGSGTLAIEAALMATGRKPGLLRSNYSFMHTKDYSPDKYNNAYKQLEDEVHEIADGCRIIATDISADAVEITMINAGLAGIDHHITTAVCDFTQTEIPGENKGAVMFNPEYGDRLGEETALQETYKLMGDFLKKECKGYTGCIFTGNLDLAKKIGLKPARRIEFYTGKIDCRLFLYDLYEGTRDTKKM